MNNEVIIKSWNELTPTELEQMNASHKREWDISGMTEEYHGENIFFLLKDSDRVLAHGQLVPIPSVIFNGETFDLLGIGGIIANTKRKGYGRTIMNAVRDYILKDQKSAVGFIGLPEFYLACGFAVDKDAINRFVYREGDKKITNTESTHICYLNGDDNFMEKVLTYPDQEVLLPRTPDW